MAKNLIRSSKKLASKAAKALRKSTNKLTQSLAGGNLVNRKRSTGH